MFGSLPMFFYHPLQYTKVNNLQWDHRTMSSNIYLGNIFVRCWQPKHWKGKQKLNHSSELPLKSVNPARQKLDLFREEE